MRFAGYRFMAIASEAQMLKAFALIGLGAVFALSSEVSVALTGYGTRPNSHPNSSFQRHWNRNNESKDRTRHHRGM